MRRALEPFAILAVAWLGFVAYAWPGIMTWDSVNQLLQARSGAFGDWHPPLMAATWSVLDSIVRGPSLMLVLQTSLVVLGLFALFRHYFAPRRAAVVAACVFLFPPVFAPLSAIWKDSLMTGLVLCGAAGLVSERRLAQAGGWFALAFAAGLRHNAPILIVPLTMMLVPYGAAWRPWRRRALGIALGVAVSLAGALVDRALTRKHEYPFANMIALADTAGIIDVEPALADDARVRELLDGIPLTITTDIQARMRELRVADIGWLITNAEHPPFAPATSEAQAAAFVAAFRRAVAAYPASYLRYRWRVFRATLGILRGRPRPFVTAQDEDPAHLGYVGETRDHARYQLAIARGLRAISRWIVFWPMLYVILALGLLTLLWRDPLQRGLLLGALGYEATLLVLSPGGRDYRYSHWLIVCTVIATVVRMSTLATLGPRVSARASAASSAPRSCPPPRADSAGSPRRSRSWSRTRRTRSRPPRSARPRAARRASTADGTGHH